jgi:osomolarity two-component system phosphorelay intermediate protein YPD1
LLSSLGHLLKSSSAALGLTKLKESCRKIQYYGQKKDDTGTIDEPDDTKCLSKIKETVVAVRREYAEAEKILKSFFAR